MVVNRIVVSQDDQDGIRIASQCEDQQLFHLRYTLDIIKVNRLSKNDFDPSITHRTKKESPILTSNDQNRVEKLRSSHSFTEMMMT